ncbi:MAG: hypothetical protein WBG46_11285 [Nonlabens sp.]
MKNFNELSKEWPRQKPALITLPDRISHVKNKQFYTIAVLAVTVLILVIFFTYVYNPAEPIFNLGMGLMIGSVASRVLIEAWSVNRLKQQSPDLAVIEYQKELKGYLKNRLKIHQIATPAILVTYWIGFVLLIPTFKENLSSFMFQYVCWSSIPIASVMVWFISFQIKKEKKSLLDLIKEQEGL